jgi:hypothetical protein
MQVDLDVLFGLQFLLKHQLLTATLFNFSFGLHELLLLLHGLLHDFSSLEKLALHVVDLLEELLLLGLLFLLLLVLFIKFSNKALTVLLSNFLLGQNAGLLLFKILGHLLLLSLKLSLKFLHLASVHNVCH